MITQKKHLKSETKETVMTIIKKMVEVHKNREIRCASTYKFVMHIAMVLSFPKVTRWGKTLYLNRIDENVRIYRHRNIQVLIFLP